MAFIDRIQIKLASGHGGKGAVHFKRTRRSPRAGPDGGDGGKGGDLILSPKASLTDFSHLSGQALYKAEDGKPGEKGKKKGARGKDLVVYVPEGTLCYDSKEKLLQEVKNKEWRFLKGGKGGKGNHFFKNARLQAPQTAQSGQPSVQTKVTLELKWMSDVCLIGHRNCGKTALLLNLSQRKERLYPSSCPRFFSVKAPAFTSPVLFVDLPGLSPSTRKFLKQAERTKIIILMIPLKAADPFFSYQNLKQEILSYDQECNSNLSQKDFILLLRGEKNSLTVEKIKPFNKVSIKTISFFNQNNPHRIKELINTILAGLMRSPVSDTTRVFDKEVD